MLFNYMAAIISGKAFKRSFLILIALSFHRSGQGQTVKLPQNSNGNVEYYHAVETDSIPYPVLWDKAIEFLRALSVPGQLTKEVRSNENLTELVHEFGFYLYMKPALTKQIGGVLMADISVKIENT
jgi:hypothetical protein